MLPWSAFCLGPLSRTAPWACISFIFMEPSAIRRAPQSAAVCSWTGHFQRSLCKEYVDWEQIVCNRNASCIQSLGFLVQLILGMSLLSNIKKMEREEQKLMFFVCPPGVTQTPECFRAWLDSRTIYIAKCLKWCSPESDWERNSNMLA